MGLFGKKKSITFKPVSGNYVLSGGLPLVGGTMCLVSLTETGVSISAPGAKFNIAIEKITSISTKTDTEIQENKQLVSSIGGALVGAALFGLPGAIVGGGAKEKTVSNTVYHNFMVITYKKDNSLSSVVFALKGSPMEAMPFITNFALINQNKQSEVVEL